MKKDQEIDTSSRLSHLSKRTPKNGAWTERTWYLIWKAADRCLLKAGHSKCCCTGRHCFVASRFKYINNFVSKVTSRKNQISQKRYRLSNRHLQCPFPRRSNPLVAWVSHDFAFRRACLTQLRAGLFLWKSSDLHYGLLARQVVERQLNHNMTFQVPAQKFTSLGVKFETLVTKGLLSYSAKSRTVLKSNLQNCYTVCWWLLNI